MKRFTTIIALAFVYATVAWGVNLPSKSYIASQYSEKTVEIQSVLSTGSTIKGSFVGSYQDCNHPGEPTLCADCCQREVLNPCSNECGENQVCLNECFSLYLSCTNSCETGHSLPLTGGEPFILALAGLFYGIRAALKKK